MDLVALFRAGLALTTAGLGDLGWEQCGHGLTSRPREAAEVGFLDDLPVLFGYPAQSGFELVAGTSGFGIVRVLLLVRRPKVVVEEWLLS